MWRVKSMRIHLSLALWVLALLAPQQPPPAIPASPVPATRLQTRRLMLSVR